MKRAFTLIELLVVIAIIAILAAILFPVFAQAKIQAKKAASISNNKQLALATLMYMNDADDRFMPWGYTFSYRAYPLPSDEDQLQIIYPYITNKYVMVDPLDPAGDSDRWNADGDLTDPNTVPAAYKDAQALLNWTAVADWGLNVQYLQPAWLPPPYSSIVPDNISQTEIVRPAQIFMATSSVWGRRASGTPYGGGNAGVDPPCVFLPDGTDTRPGSNPTYSYYWYGAWQPTSPLAWNVFGGVWPWYNSGQIFIASYCDGHAKAVPIGAAATGCNVQDSWGGFITNPSIYNWASTL
ncbi:MAG: prepilin-type N-terminal cleavage/methylation domain-containing protein [Fimbriimonadaceae bacterium]